MILKEQSGKQIYSDGQKIEEQMLALARRYPGESAREFVGHEYGYTINNTFSAVRENILNWYPFKKNATVLEIGAGMGALTEFLARSCKKVVSVEMNELRAETIRERTKHQDNVEVQVGDINTLALNEQFDYVVFIGVLEYAAVFNQHSQNPFLDFISKCCSYLKDDGKLLFAIENQYGLKYWCGAAEDHLQQPFKGIEGYQAPNTARTFSKQGLSDLLTAAGMKEQRFYYVYPDYKFPTFIYTDEWKPSASDFQNIAFTYGKNSILTADEKKIYGDLAENGVLNFFANSFLVESSKKELESVHPILITARSEVRSKYRVDTVIDTNGILTKKAVHPHAEEHLQHIFENETQLERRGVPVLKSNLTKEGLKRDIYQGQRADQVIAELLNADELKMVLALLEQLKAALLRSSALSETAENYLIRNHLADDSVGFSAVLKDGFIDMTFYNAFIIDGQLTFFDQEWRLMDLPLEFVLYYAVKSIYARNQIDSVITADMLYQYLHITPEQREVFDRAEEFVWSQVLYRQGDLYGEGGYCVQYGQAAKFAELQGQQEENQRLHQEICNRDGHIEQLLQSERELKGETANKTAHIEQLLQSERELKEDVISKTAHIGRLLQSERELRVEVTEWKNRFAQAEQEVGSLKTALVQRKEKISQLNTELINKNGHIELLLESDRELERIKASRSWRFMGYAWKLRDSLIPKGSKRRLIGKMAVKFVKHPIRFLGKCSPTRVRKFFVTLRREGVEGTSRRLNDCLIGTDIQAMPIVVSELAAEPMKTAADYEKLFVPQWDHPQVSIIIPVYNQFNYTYLCIKSILANSADVTYEIIIADDCSTDLTVEIDEIIEGLHTIHNAQNLRFLRNCNNAAKAAKGQYILFLNNDTQVQENWLTPLVELIERDERNGMVGSKLIYPDGRLQEAGGILWRDGSAWNFGNRSDPDLPEFNYVKEVDYISGAAIMIRHSLWREIGGFDERFAPAYCEDSDLACEVRAHGYRVLYQPQSVVVHFEGVSNGTDTSSGQKAYQVVNQKKFYEKWEHVLEGHYPNAENVFRARERGKDKKYLLMVDHYVPQFDQDAGSRTVYQYIQLFVNRGYQVKFIGDNFFPHQPYTQVLQQMGVEVLYGSYYANHWQQWLKENGENIGYAFLNRPHITVKYIDLVRKYTPAEIVYYGHDLHFLRERREYELTREPALLQSSETWKEKELDLMRKADCAYYPSSVEVQEIHSIAPDVNVKAIPAYLFTDVKDNEFRAEERRDLMFIGGFGHKPNVDAVRWLAEDIMPYLTELLPDVKVHILGSNPPEAVKKLESAHLKIEGFVTDEQLREFYKNCRLDIVPLRYGAGIKGKVVEAMRYGMPVVTTSVGAEGIQGAGEILAVADDAETFAKQVAALYHDTAELTTRSAASLEYVRANFSPENAADVIGSEFDM